jgi:phospholipid/cholesterol/gamma-HCH transport system substrate-binding protein
MKKRKQGDELRAGIFVLAGVLVFTAAIFLLGQKSALFTRTTSLFVEFNDISGLVVGAPVRLAGLEVGTVAAISLPEALAEKRARVHLVVQSRVMPRMRADSEAFIDSAGLLGDKVVNISMGSPRAAGLADGATLKTGQPIGFEALSGSLNRTVHSLVNITGAVEGMVTQERTEQLQVDVARIAASLANILGEVEDGDGLLHRVIYDQRYADHVGVILTQARATAEKANRAMGRVDAVLAEVEHGDGTMHELVYGADGKRALASLGAAAQELSDVVSEVKNGEGVLHALVYEQGHDRFLDDLNQISAVLRGMVEDVDKGRGTFGGLLRDPTVYEDLKSLLGNVKRNVVFKALVRFTMENEQLRRADEAPAINADSQGPAKGASSRQDDRADSLRE